MQNVFFWLLTLSSLLTPLLWSGGVLLALLLIYRWLQRNQRFRFLGWPYLFSSLLLALILVLDGEGWLPEGWLRNALLATLVISWSFVLLDLLEEGLLYRYFDTQRLKMPRLVRDIVRALTLIVVVLITINLFFGVQLNSLLISSTVLSAVLGLALQDLLKNVIAGVALQVERPYTTGDWVEVQGQIARVVEMSWRATRLVNVDGTQIIIPNATLAQADINNYTIDSPLQAQHVQLAVAYGHAPNEVKRVLEAATLAAEGVVASPRPGVRLVQYGDYSVTYDIKYWMYGFDRYIETRDAVMTNAWYFLHRAGIKFPFPVRDVFLHEVDPLQVADDHSHHVRDLASSLARTELFGMLDPHELAALAERVELRLYGSGEVLARQGELEDSLFLIRRGLVRVDVRPPSGVAVTVARLGAGEFFGELALLTGEPRTATVLAEQDTETLVIQRSAIAPLLERNPLLPERLGAVLAQRMQRTRAVLDQQPEPDAELAPMLGERGLVGRIRSMFGLASRNTGG